MTGFFYTEQASLSNNVTASAPCFYVDSEHGPGTYTAADGLHPNRDNIVVSKYRSHINACLGGRVNSRELGYSC